MTLFCYYNKYHSKNRIHNLHYEKFQDGTVKCIEDEIPFEVPEGWEWTRLVSICLKVTDGTHHSRLIPIPPQNEQRQISANTSKLIELIVSIEKSKDDVLELIATTKSKILDLAIRGKLVPQDPNDEPASILLERIRAEKEELIKQGKIKRDKKKSVIFKGDDNSYYQQTGDLIESILTWELEELPDNWVLCCLGELCDYGNCNNVDADSIAGNAWILDLEDIEKNTGKVLRKIRKNERDFTSTYSL